MRKRGFTLIELLVVIAVIAALAAILFPVFGRAQWRARRVQCVSNMRQIGIAITAYTDDWDQRYPYGRTSFGFYKGWPPSVPAWHEVLAPYVPSRDVWNCPSDNGETFPRDSTTFGDTTPPFHRFLCSSYIYPGLTHEGAVLAGRPISRVPRPTLAPLIFDSRPWHSDYDPQGLLLWDPAPINILYCDGHASQRTRMQIQGDEYEAYRRR